MDESSLVVIAQQCCDTSRGSIAAGEYVRLPIVEALELSHADKVKLADWGEQQLPDLPVKRGRYQRRDLRAEP